MSLRRHALLLAVTMPVAACSGQPPATGNVQNDPVDRPAASDQSPPVVVPAGSATAPAPIHAATVEADYLGKWIGPEGLVLDVTPKPGGGVTVFNQWTLDDKGTFAGEVSAKGLRFRRKGETVTAFPSDGDATGMKWLAGKKTCLTVTPGSEGYCRD